MKKFTIISILLLMVSVSCMGQDQLAEAWRFDLDYLTQRIEIMHPDPYARFDKEAFYRVKEKLHNKIPDLDDVEIVLSISELLSTLEDGHTRWAFEHSDPQWLQKTFHVLPVIQYAFKDGIYIMAGLQQYQSLVGSKVLQIGKMSIAEVTSKLGKLWSHDNESG